MDGEAFCFGPFRLVARERVLLKDDAPVRVGDRAFDLLMALVERAGETVSRKELFARVWPDVIVAKGNLRVHVAALRKVLRDGQDGHRFIINVACRGYRFVAPVSRVQSTVRSAAGPRSAATLRPRLEPMFGHDSAIVTLSSRLSRKRFISLAGPAGWGSTGVAFAIACTLAADFDDAVFLVDCEGIEDPGRVPMAVATALGCEARPQSSPTGVLAYLRDKEVLLVFDNCDHVFAGVAQFTERLFTEAPRVHVLVISGEAPRLTPLAHGAHRDWRVMTRCADRVVKPR